MTWLGRITWTFRASLETPWDEFDRDWHVLDGELALKRALEDGC